MAGTAADGGEMLLIDGAEPPSAELVARVGEACDRVEARGGPLIVRVSGAPADSWTDGLTVALVSRWERALRRLERLPAATVGIADGDCGGTALDALLATDSRVATTSARLAVPVDSSGTWPGMALYRLVHQGANAAAIRRAVLFGDPIGALDALALQLVDDVTDDVAGALADAAGLTGSGSGAELAIRRQLMLDASTVSFEDALGVHLAACDRTLRRAAGAPA
jgi:isomerase DpgB